MTSTTTIQELNQTGMVTPYGNIRFFAVTKVDEKGADGELTGRKILKQKISLEFDGQDPEAIKLRDWISATNPHRITTIVTNPVTKKKEVLPNDNYILQFYWGLKDGKVNTRMVDENNSEYEAMPRFHTGDGDTGQARVSVKLSTASKGSKFFQADSLIQLKNLNINLDGPNKLAKSAKYNNSNGSSMSLLEAAIEAEHRGQA